MIDITKPVVLLDGTPGGRPITPYSTSSVGPSYYSFTLPAGVSIDEGGGAPSWETKWAYNLKTGVFYGAEDDPSYYRIANAEEAPEPPKERKPTVRKRGRKLSL